MILNFKKFHKINELIRNSNLTRSYADKISKEIEQFTEKVKFKYELNQVRYLLIVSNLMESEIPRLIKVLDRYKMLLEKEDIILSYQQNDSCSKEDKIQWNVFFKGKYTRRVKPNRFIYHFSSSSEFVKNNILKNGLIPYKHSDSQTWLKNAALEYPNAIFAVNNDSQSWAAGHIFKIDTEGLTNKWWEDLNFEVGTTDLIMTFEPIPPSHIELLDTQQEIERRREAASIRMQTLKKVNNEFEKLIMSNDLEGLKNKIEIHKKDLSNSSNQISPISIENLLIKSSKFGSIDIVKFLVSKYNPNNKLVNAMIRRAEENKNTEVLNYLKSI